MPDATSSCCAQFRCWPSAIFRRKVLVLFILTAISIIYFNGQLVFRYDRAVRWRRSSGVADTRSAVQGGVSSAPAASESAVFHRLHQLLSVADPAAEAECRQRYDAGGRCFHCVARSDHIMSTIDGRKPVCLGLLPLVNCSVLSFGVNHDFSFEESMEDLGCMVHAFDPTMGADSYRKSKGIHFHNLGIGSRDTDVGGFPVASLDSVVRKTRLQTGVIDYLKLDVETSEWETLHQQLTTGGPLLRVKQLNIEFHLFRWAPLLADGVGMRGSSHFSVSYENALRFVTVIEALQRAGFGLAIADPNIGCQHYDGGCLSILYDTHWVNKNISRTSAAA